MVSVCSELVINLFLCNPSHFCLRSPGRQLYKSFAQNAKRQSLYDNQLFCSWLYRKSLQWTCERAPTSSIQRFARWDDLHCLVVYVESLTSPVPRHGVDHCYELISWRVCCWLTHSFFGCWFFLWENNHYDPKFGDHHRNCWQALSTFLLQLWKGASVSLLSSRNST